MNPEDLEIQREWGFAPPEGEEWPPEVALTAQAIEHQQSNPFFSTILDAAMAVHRSDDSGDVVAAEYVMLGKVELLTDLVALNCWYQLSPGIDYAHCLEELEAGDVHAVKIKARAVVGQLLQKVSEGWLKP